MLAHDVIGDTEPPAALIEESSTVKAASYDSAVNDSAEAVSTHY